MKLLDEGLLSDCRRMYPNEVYVFQQDGATSHISRAIQSYLEDSTPSFIKKINGFPDLRIVIPWITVYKTRFQRKFTAEGREIPQDEV